MTKQITDVSNDVKNIMASYVEIGVLLVHIECIAIFLLCLKVDCFCQRRVKIWFKAICDSFNERLAVVCQFNTLALVR